MITLRNYILSVIIIIFIYYYILDSCPQIYLNTLTKNYNDIKTELDTGDLILLSSDDDVSKIIKKGSNSVFSHCGIVIRINNELLILECDITKQYDYLTGKQYNEGVHLLNLDQKIDYYYGKYGAYRKLKHNNKNPDIKLETLLDIIKSTLDIKFNYNLLIWFMIYIRMPYLNLINTHHKMICSQYIVYIYQQLNILSKDIPEYYCLPKHLSKNINTINNYKFDNPKYFKLK